MAAMAESVLRVLAAIASRFVTDRVQSLVKSKFALPPPDCPLR
jgi:hypothetical protein